MAGPGSFATLGPVPPSSEKKPHGGAQGPQLGPGQVPSSSWAHQCQRHILCVGGQESELPCPWRLPLVLPVCLPPHPVPAPLSLTPVVCASWISNGLIKDAFCQGPVLQQSGEGQTLGEACYSF